MIGSYAQQVNKKIIVILSSATVSACVVASPAVAGTPNTTSRSVASVAPAPRALPKGSFAHHDSQFWTWFGPKNWFAATGAYGISLFGPGKRYLDYGFSTVVCSSATTLSGTVNNYFAAKRADFRAQSGLRRLKLKSSAIRQLPVASYGQNYFRQSLTFSGRKGKASLRGELVFDYAVTDPVYCFARNQSRTAPSKGFTKSIRQLRSMQGALAYFGPGAPGETPNDPQLPN